MDYLEIIREKSFRPIKSSYIIPSNFTYCIEFEDGIKISKKDEVGFRIFLCSIQHLKYEIISGNIEHCISCPIGYFDLIGFRPGDAILFQTNDDNINLPILFS